MFGKGRRTKISRERRVALTRYNNRLSENVYFKRVYFTWQKRDYRNSTSRLRRNLNAGVTNKDHRQKKLTVEDEQLPRGAEPLDG